MEGLKFEEINYTNHIKKCRICFKSFTTDEHRVAITKSIEKKFFEFTTLNLKMTNQYSSLICVVCNYQLTVFSQAKRNVVKSQRGLVKFVSNANKNIQSKSSKENETIILKLDEIADENFTESKTDPIEITSLNDDKNDDKNEDKNESDIKDEIIEEHLIDDEEFLEVNQEHLKINLQQKPHICSSCNEHFESQQQLHQHRQKSHQNDLQSKWTCHFCGKSFSGGGSLTNHITIFHSTTNIELPCPVANCDKKCKTKKQLSQHLKTHNMDKQICPECGIVVGNKHNLQKHIKRLHLKIYNFYCDLCEYKGFFKFNIDQHMKKHVDKSERERFYCDECSFESISKMSLRTHKRMEHLGQKKIYTCHCGKTFTQSSSFHTHVKVVHQKIKNHICTYLDCGKTFSERSQLKNHIKSQHLKKKDLPCTNCGKLFATQKHLSAHSKYHKAPSYKCQYENCSNFFFTSTQLNSHYKVHNNQKDYACHLCDKKYFHRSHLKKHLMNHSFR